MELLQRFDSNHLLSVYLTVTPGKENEGRAGLDGGASEADHQCLPSEVFVSCRRFLQHFSSGFIF